MADTKNKPWTDAEKLGVLFQVIEKAGSIPWDELELPEGRTKKAVQIMIGKEKDKVKKAREAKGNGEPVAETPKKKRGGDEDGKESPKKKAKTPRKKKTVKAGGEDDEAKEKDEEEEAIKPELEEDELA